MLPVCTVEEMQNIDKKSIGTDTKKGFALMNEAAQGLADFVNSLASETYINDIVIFPSLTIVCGKGNNGGDGFKLASLLSEKKFNLKIFSLAEKGELRGEALMAFDEIKKYQDLHDLDLITYIKSNEDLNHLDNHLAKDLKHEHNKPHFLIESLLGIGVQGEPHGLYAETCKIINNHKARNLNLTIIAADCPTGHDNNQGTAYKNAIQADYTVTMGLPKIGSFFYPAKTNYGKVSVQSLNYPGHIIEEGHKSQAYIAEDRDLKSFLAQRDQTGSKYDHGVVTLIAGSEGMTGAATLAASAAMRSGLGLLHIFSDSASCKIIACNIVEAVLHDISTLSQAEMQAKFLAGKVNVLCIGPGLGANHHELVQNLVQNSKIPVILDADGINAFAGKRESLKNRACDLLLTPHPGEYMRLFPEDDLKSMSPLETINTLRARAQELKATILLKGATTIVADPGGKVFINNTGNSALATAGSGDVLSGIIAGLAAQLAHRQINQKLSVLTQAAILGAHLHGKAAELASEQLTEYGVIARDLIAFFPLAIREILTSPTL